MTSKAAVGFSDHTNTREAAAQAARTALDRLGQQPQLAFLFATSKHDPKVLVATVRELLGPGPRLIGGSAVGVITNEQFGYTGYQVGVAVIASDRMKIDIFRENGLPDREEEVGAALGRQMAGEQVSGERSAIVLFDMIKRSMSEGLSFNMAAPLIDGLQSTLGEWPNVVGAGLIGDMHFSAAYEWLDDEVLQQSALGIVISGNVRTDTVTMHGCKPASDYHMITKAEGNVVLELDGRPTVEVIGQMLGIHSGSEWQDYPLFLTLGVNRADKFDDFREEDYTVRLCMDIDRDRGGLVMFGNDLQEGVEVQLMRREIAMDHVGRRTNELLTRVKEQKPFFAFYINCAGRARAICASEREDAEEVQRAIGDVPLLGFYTGCEIAPANDELESHNWTGVLCVLSEV